MSEFFKKYIALRRHNFRVMLKKAKQRKMCYLFLAPYAILFAMFFVFPVVASICLSFTYYNILETPRFVGFQNYIKLILEDDIFLISIKNTFMIAIITGPLGYILSFIFAWLINELPRWVRSVAVIVFYAPSIAGNCYVIFSVFFRGDAYGHANALLMNMGIIDAEAGCMDGIKNRWQELWYITLPSMKPMLLFGAVMSITQAFGVCDVTMALCGYPSTDYAARTIVTHLFDYGFSRFEMGYACAIATILFLIMILCNKAIQSLLRRVGT